MSVNFFDNVLLFIPGDTESNFGGPVWLGCIMRNKFYDQFQKQPFWVDDKHIELDVIRLDVGDIALKIHWYEHIPVISGSDLVYIL